jgi:hypothetical protein
MPDFQPWSVFEKFLKLFECSRGRFIATKRNGTLCIANFTSGQVISCEIPNLLQVYTIQCPMLFF